jgi:Zn-dependent protease/CBS domain-containing protein
MKTRWKLGRLFGIDVYLHPTFLLLLAWFAVSDLLRGERPMQMAAGIGLVLCVFAVVLLHEIGHALVARRFGIQTRRITLLPIGGVSSLERLPERPLHELLIAIAGPLVNLVIALVLFLLTRALGQPVDAQALAQANAPLLPQLVWINLSLAIFNLLPAFPMDGGRVLRALLSLRLGRLRATDAAAVVGRAIALGLGLIGLFGNPFLVVLALFVWLGATSEAWGEHVRSALAGVTVGHAMVRQMEVLDANDTLSHAAELSHGLFQRDFPVMRGQAIDGVLTHQDLLRGIGEQGPAATVGAVAQHTYATAQPDEPLDRVMTRLQASQPGVILVVDHGRLAGMLTAQRLQEILALDDAKSHAA